MTGHTVNDQQRCVNYYWQTGYGHLTPRQVRRLNHKRRRGEARLRRRLEDTA